MKDITKLVVIGIDGLDIEKAREWEPGLLLQKNNELDMSQFDMLKTYHIWPTMFSGDKPEERGFEGNNSEVPSERGSWENPVVDFASLIFSKILPRSTRRKIGWKMAELGINIDTVNHPGRSLFEGDTVFTDMKSRVIEVPGWNKREMDLEFNTAGAWSQIMVDDKGVEKFVRSLNEEEEIKRKETLEAMDMPYDIVWTHFHFLDAAQHFLDKREQKEWYSKAQNLVDEVVEKSDERTLVVVLSDHGLAGGNHREPGIVAVNGDFTPLPEKPSDVRSWIETRIMGEKVETNQETLEDLEALGYRDFVED